MTNGNLFIVRMLMVLSAFNAQASAQVQQGWHAPENTVRRLLKESPEFNYDEEKIPVYKLPELMVSQNGNKVTTQQDWIKMRRPELLELFRTTIYGRVPSTKYKESFKVVNEDRNAMGGAATLKQVDIIVDADKKSLAIHLILFTPNKVTGPVPAFLLISLGSKNIDPARVDKNESWPAEEIVARGYAAAAFSNSDVDPDNFDDFKNGIHGVLDRGVRPDDAWGTIAAWAWGASRCMDYLETDNAIKKNEVAVVGHSRGGKTALWAGAVDDRFSMVISNESGCGGAAIARRRFGETVARINTTFPHWFCSNYKKYNNNENNLPVDMHELLALTAPRALYVSAADEDLWGDPKGCYLALYYSLPAFRLFGINSDLPEALPPLEKQVISGKTGFHIRKGEHRLSLQDWNLFMDFAKEVWK